MKSIHDPRYIRMIGQLREVRKSKKINQETLGQRLKWNQQDISRVESLVRRLDFIELRDWLEALDCKLEDFLKDVDRP